MRGGDINAILERRQDLYSLLINLTSQDGA